MINAYGLSKHAKEPGAKILVDSTGKCNSNSRRKVSRIPAKMLDLMRENLSK